MGVTIINSGLRQEKGITYSEITDSSADWINVTDGAYFYDIATDLPYYKSSSGLILSLFSEANTLYTSNGTLTGDRTIDQGSHTLTFEGNNTSFVSSNSDISSNILEVQNSSNNKILEVREGSNITINSHGSAGSSTLSIYDNSNARIFNFSENGRVNFSNLPTNAAGLSSGDLWDDGGIVRIGNTVLPDDDSLYTTDSTIGSNRVATLTDNLTFQGGNIFTTINSSSTDESDIESYPLTLRNTELRANNLVGMLFQDNSTDDQARIYTKFGTKNSINFDVKDGTFQNLLKLEGGNVNMSNLPTTSTGLGAGDLWSDNGDVRIGTSTPTPVSSIYTADGALTGNRAVDLDNNILTFDVGTFSGVGVDKGLIIDGSDYQITNTNATNSFLEVFNENGSVFNAMQRGGILSYSDVNPLAFLLSRDSTKGLKLDTNNSRISTNELIFNNSFSGNQGIYLRGSGTTNDLFFRNSSNQIQHWIRQGDSLAIASFFYSGMSGKGFIVGGSSAISTEDISLQGDTLISKQLELSSTEDGLLMNRLTTAQRDAISTPDTHLLIFNTDNERIERYDGTAWIGETGNNIYSVDGTLTEDRTVDFDGNKLTFDFDQATTTEAEPINFEFGGGFGGYYSRWDDNGGLTIKSASTYALRVVSKVDANASMFHVGKEGGGFMSTNGSRVWTISGEPTDTTKNEFSGNRISQYFSGTEYHRIQVGGSGTGVHFFQSGISGSLGRFIVGGSTQVSSEDISLQGDTLISKKLELSSTDDGFLMNRLTTAQRDAISTPDTHLLIFNTDNERIERYDGVNWVGETGGGNIYTADGTVGAGRVATLTDNLILKTASSTEGFKIEYSYSTENAFYVGGYGSGYWMDESSGYIAIGERLNKTHTRFTNNGLEIYENATRKFNFQSGGNELINLFEDGSINGTGSHFVINSNAVIGTEKISLQSSTAIKGNGTSTGSALSIYNGASTPSKIWDFLDNGTLSKPSGVMNITTIGNGFNIGRNITNTSSSSTTYAIGKDHIISGTGFGKFALGDDLVLSKTNSYAFGREALIRQGNSVIMGFNLDSAANGAFILGYGTGATTKLLNNTPNSLALGWNTTTPQHLLSSTGSQLGGKTELTSTTDGFLMNRLTTAQRDAISTPDTHLLIFNTDNDRIERYDGTAWVGETGGGDNIYTADGSLTTDRVINLAGSNLSTSDTSNAGTAKIVLDSGEALVVDRTFNGYTANFQSSGVTHTSLGDSVSVFGSNTLRLGSLDGNNGLVIQGDRVRYFTTVDSAGDIHDIHAEKFTVFGDGFSSPSNSYFSVGSFSRIGSEDISLQGNTLLNAEVSMPNIPTVSTGVSSGEVWSQNGTLKIGSPSDNFTITSTVLTLTVNSDTTELAKVLALSNNITIAAPTGTPNDNQELWFRILDNGTSRSITLNSAFEDYTGNFPAATTVNKKLIFSSRYDADNAKWNILDWKIQP